MVTFAITLSGLLGGTSVKGWAQMAVFVLSPYLSTNERKVLLSLSKVCNVFTPLCISDINIGVPNCILFLLICRSNGNKSAKSLLLM